MPLHDLSPPELAILISPTNHPDRLSAEELHSLTSHLSESQLDDVIRRLGVAVFLRQLPPTFHRVLLAAQRVTRNRSPDEDHDSLIEDLIRDLGESSLEASTPPPSSPPSSPEPPATPSRARQVRSTPSTPQTAPVRPPRYTFTTPTGTGRSANWLEAGALTQGTPGSAVRSIGGGSTGSQPQAAAYAIFFGAEIRVFPSWADVQSRTTGHGLAIFGGYVSTAAAAAALAYISSLASSWVLSFLLLTQTSVLPVLTKGWTGDSTPPPYDAVLPTPMQQSDNPINAGAVNAKWYAVSRGVAPEVYRSWLECSLNVLGIKGSVYKSYKTRSEAENAFNEAWEKNWSKCKRSTDAEVLARRAQAAWQYRQRNRAAVNERARIRMQKRREALKNAPSDFQGQARHKARQYRRRYTERTQAQSTPTPQKETKKNPQKTNQTHAAAPEQRQPLTPPKAALPPAPAMKLRRTPSPFRASPGKLVDLNLPKPHAPRGSTNRMSTPPTPTPSSRKPPQRAPRSLAAIDADDDDSPEDDNEQSDDEPAHTGHRLTGIQRWWEYLDADGPLLNITGHPDYVPQRGQQPYMKGPSVLVLELCIVLLFVILLC
ncbi:hypothetical protein C8F04DRAFT_1274620 [Mycena alexandri]|uniref:Ribonuclease H1 N-terminal domain-containing protein n=1 Tax=Mycena alexandri TaxID=1745969 RepID=A0AAD6S3U4_9AGAR|nr:hypothetical protein C8F04DRAFT_1274620 [Mycena alexandri]